VEELKIISEWTAVVTFAELVSQGMVVWIGVGFKEDAV
jgi:hypothetical protein